MEKRARTQDELSALSNQALADLLLDYHQGPETALYVVASIMFSGHDPETKHVKLAANELTEVSSALQDYRKIEAVNLSNELSSRYPENNMKENELVDWVKGNCKFAQMQQSKLLGPQELQPLFTQIAQGLSGAVQQDADPSANYNAVRKQVTMALQSALKQRGGTIQDVNGAVGEIMKMMGVESPAPQAPAAKPLQMQAPKPMAQGPAGWEPPGMSALRNRPKI